MWKSGDCVILRGVYNRRVWIAQSAFVVKDTREETALAMLPGAECMMPEGYVNGKHGERRAWDRWKDYKTNDCNMVRFFWHTNRLLLLLEPDKYYATVYFWKGDTDEFLCYYINFQIPFQRSKYGFDTLDLELDIVIEPSFKWKWKDLEEYQDGINKGIILKEWTEKIDNAKTEVFQKIEQRQYPLDGKWLNWYPDPSWSSPKLPADWDKV